MPGYARFFAIWCQALLLAAAFVVPARAAPTHIAASLVAEGAAAPGKTVTLAFVMRPEKGWHGYWKNPGDAGFGMTLDWALPEGASAGTLLYPVPHTLVIAGLMNHVYEEDYVLLAPLTLPANAVPGSRLPVRVKADWLACTDKICVPERAELATEVVVSAPGTMTPPDPRFDGWRAKLPAPLGSVAMLAAEGQSIRLGIPLPRGLDLQQPHVFADADRVVAYGAAQEFRRKGDLLIVTLTRAPNAAAPQAFSGLLRLNRAGDGVEFAARPGPVPTGGELVGSKQDAGGNLALLVLAALAGGLLLNVMPCVFPILSLKALSLARAGESEAEARAEGLAYSAGVVLACSALGALMLALRAGGSEIGWAFQLQEPGVVAVLLLVAAAVTANLAGLYEFAVPGFARAGSPQGAFATGLLAAFVATPCTGPFMAAAMGAALLLPAAQAMVLFAALGLGLALPFLAIALVPPLRRLLPRPGAWMNRLRMIMAVPMGLTTLALVWLASRVGGMGFAGLALGLALALVALLEWTGSRQRRGLSALVPTSAGIAAIAALGAVVLPQHVSAPAAETAGLLPSAPFSAEALARARAAGKPVFAYFTADWCLTCKVNEQVAIERAETRDAFARAGVVVLRGDWTRRDPAITRYLAEQGAAGVPLYVWYAPGGAAETLPQLLTPDLLTGLPAKNR
ncbi:thioredoxin family protein [Novosphingobium flavum]|uniref:Thioredoxin family protein n=1 Tax=Novosphingobium flavum TaxID=1778672 RepID=A0A7X1FRI4_9SPHN|nr:thioredoxin family protein [Novosphingobium flavum]MBC2665644.1 thioredoxin family protein [Novosphingobium flavum]